MTETSSSILTSQEYVGLPTNGDEIERGLPIDDPCDEIGSGARNLDADVIIVGGGPAGSTTALALRKYNPDLRILLLDRASFPRDKACGDGIGPGAVRVLGELGVSEVVAGAACPLTVHVTGPAGTSGSATGPLVAGRELTGRVLPRLEFDDRLLTAAKVAGADVREGVTFVGSRLTGVGREVIVRESGSEATSILHSRLVVGADGALSKVRGAFGVEKQDQSATHLALRSYVSYTDPDSPSPDENPMRIDFTSELLPAYGWVFPVGTGTANIGVGLPLSDVRRRKVNINGLLDEYVEVLKGRGFAMDAPERRSSALLPHAKQLGPLAHPRGALVGDAGGMINPLSGEGIAYGMVAGSMLGRTLAEWDGSSVAELEGALRYFE